MLKAVIFDMDGLMIDSERVTYESYCKVMGERNLPFSVETYRNVLGKTKEKIFETFRGIYGQDLPMEEIYPQVHVYNNQEYDKNGVPVKPGLRELLKLLKDHNMKTIIATSSNRHRVEDILKRTELEGWFDDMVCGDDITHSKPNPEIFLTACEKAGVKPEEALVLEDSEAGIEASHAAGVPVICVIDMKNPTEDHVKMTKAVTNSLEEVTEILKEELE